MYPTPGILVLLFSYSRFDNLLAITPKLGRTQSPYYSKMAKAIGIAASVLTLIECVASLSRTCQAYIDAVHDEPHLVQNTQLAANRMSMLCDDI